MTTTKPFFFYRATHAFHLIPGNIIAFGLVVWWLELTHVHVVVRLSARAPSRLLQGGRPYFLASAGDDALVNIFDSVYDFILLFFIASDTGFGELLRRGTRIFN